MTDRTTDFLDFPDADRLRAAGEVVAPGPAIVEAALLAVRAAAASEKGGPVPGAAPRRLRTRRLLVSAAAIAAIAAGVSVYPVSSLRGSPPAATATAADFLRQVAATEAKGAATDAPYWRTHAVRTVWGHPDIPQLGYSETPTVSDSSTWVGPDSLFFQDGVDGEIVKTPAKQYQWMMSVARAGGAGLSWEEVKRLPSDSTALKVVLEEFFPGGPWSSSQAEPGADYVFSMGNLLSYAPLEPRQRAAVYEVLADMPGLRLVGPATDSTGRAGTAVEVDTRNSRIRLVIDPKKGGLLETTTHYLGGRHDGKLARRETILSAGPMRSIPAYREMGAGTRATHPAGPSTPDAP
ncbi:hypothetical protein [Streptomyces sp. NPDC006463]|uniref:hypothetical protein n=1 Tax=Streptomyces sp. NPDC006463 TaxID=3364746 RepID=UPI0036931A3B